MEQLQHFGHEHPLVFTKDWSHESEKTRCSSCGELVSGPSYSCVECKFYLDKQCAEAPSELNHPFHRNHSFRLLKWPPYFDRYPKCHLCNQTCRDFVYHCSCDLDLHIKCALLSGDIAEKCADLPPQINHPLHPRHPLVLQFKSEHLSCNICKEEQLRGLVYCCSSCAFVLDIECSSLPTTIKKSYHRKHPLVLRTVDDPLDCKICQQTTQSDEFIYFCSVCEFGLHIGCVSPPPTIADETHHAHPFTLLQLEVSFNCDACGTFGNYVPYFCSTCNIMVHKKCISLPRIIKFYRHHHCISLTYSIDGFNEWECRFCHEDVNTKHGSYFCAKCNYIVHVNCVLEEGYYDVVSSIEIDEASDSADEPMESIEYVTGTSIKHFNHDHILALGDAIKVDKQCDACVLLISGSYYYCSQCDFFVHEACAKLPRKKYLWFHYCQKIQTLASDCIFSCHVCGYRANGFHYRCDGCDSSCCISCALLSDIHKHEAHEHALPFYSDTEQSCNGCGLLIVNMHRCKSCDFNLCVRCLILPLEARHKFDEHRFKLTYHDSSDYAKSHVCDICEKERNPNHWFYHCATCDNSAHTGCALGKYPRIKQGSICKYENHPHPLTFVKKVGLYPDCSICGEHCVDLSLECKEGCSYIIHWDCIKHLQLSRSLRMIR